MNDIDRLIGEHNAEIQSLKAQVQRIEDRLQEVTSILHEARGSWRTLVGVATFAGALGAGATKLIGLIR